MTVNLRVLVPDDTINYIKNPAFRYATTGWTAVGAAISRTLTYARFNVASLQVVTNGAAIHEGTYYRVSNIPNTGGPVTVSAYVRGTGTVRIRVVDNPLGASIPSAAIALTLDSWTRIEVTGAALAGGGNDVRLYVETDGPAKAITFYVDGAQMEMKPQAGSYCDGDQPGCRWNIVNHDSLSSRLASTRQGGKWVALAGPCRDVNQNIYVTQLGGAGMAPMTNTLNSWAVAPGSYYQSTKINNRVITMAFHTKNELSKDKSRALLHGLRQQLIDIFKMDKTAGGEAFLFEYSDTDAVRPLYIRLRYEAGLEGDWDIRNGFTESFPIRFVAVDPFWMEDSQNVKQLNFLNAMRLAGADALAGGYARVNGEWSMIPANATVPNAFVSAIQGNNGTIYIGGFDATTPKVLMKWDGTTLTGLAPGGASVGIQIAAIAEDASGNLYVGGFFTTINGVAANRIAKYNVSTGVFSALGTGISSGSSTVNAIVIVPDGKVYVFGSFTQAGGVSRYNIAYWDGNWHTVGASSGVNFSVICAALSADKTKIYFGGNFTAEYGGTDCKLVGQIDLTTNLISQPTTYGIDDEGATKSVQSMAVASDGTLYVGGNFRRVATLLTSLNRIAYLKNNATTSPTNTYGWTRLGAGFSDSSTVVLSLDFYKNSLYCGGIIPTYRGVNMYGTAIWIGSTFVPLDFAGNKNSLASNIFQLFKLIASENGDIFLFGSHPIASPTTQSVMASKTTVVNNPGTAAVYPTLYVKGSGKLKYLENVNTNVKIYFDYELADGEELFIDFATSTVLSSTRGNVVRHILNGSGYAGFMLLPGNNTISAFMLDDVDAVMQIGCQPRHWSVDAVTIPQELS